MTDRHPAESNFREALTSSTRFIFGAERVNSLRSVSSKEIQILNVNIFPLQDKKPELVQRTEAIDRKP